MKTHENRTNFLENPVVLCYNTIVKMRRQYQELLRK